MHLLFMLASVLSLLAIMVLGLSLVSREVIGPPMVSVRRRATMHKSARSGE